MLEKVIELIEEIQDIHKQKYLVSGESLETYYKLEDLKNYVRSSSIWNNQSREREYRPENPQQLTIPFQQLY